MVKLVQHAQGWTKFKIEDCGHEAWLEHATGYLYDPDDRAERSMGECPKCGDDVEVEG